MGLLLQTNSLRKRTHPRRTQEKASNIFRVNNAKYQTNSVFLGMRTISRYPYKVGPPNDIYNQVVTLANHLEIQHQSADISAPVRGSPEISFPVFNYAMAK